MSIDEDIKSGDKEESLTDTRLENILKRFRLEKNQLTQIRDSIESEFYSQLSISRKTYYYYHPVKAINTNLVVVPKGGEHGLFVALDLGGTTLRILTISISMEAFLLTPSPSMFLQASKLEVENDYLIILLIGQLRDLNY
ncbi:Hexokinase-1 [Thelohanellus kitauei]|uniref:Phosphotransferase n=1 Tax=Thelohanellus kitauei TaxID=669202 RepID=A0A0C2IZU6_THEKT|nr:Hexokinase-1 [Thelohanellus kitauei]